MPRPWGWVGSPRRVALAESYYFHGTRKEEGDHDRLGSPGQSSALPRRSRARRLAFRVHPTAPDPSTLRVMSSLSHPLRFLLVALTGWIHQQQRDVIDYLQAENRVLREQLGPRRLRFTDDQRVRLAAKAKRLDGCSATSSRS
jgi:hypothetical protein